MKGSTLVLGASPDPGRYANVAVRRLRAAGHPVVAVGKRSGLIGDVPIVNSVPDAAVVDTVTLYLAPANQIAWHDALLALHPRRVIFNPGSEDAVFAAQLRATGVEVLDACTLVMLSTGQY